MCGVLGMSTTTSSSNKAGIHPTPTGGDVGGESE